MKRSGARRRSVYLLMVLGLFACVLPAAARAQEALPDTPPTLIAESTIADSSIAESSSSAEMVLPLDSSIRPFVAVAPVQPSRLFGFIPNYATVEGGAPETPLTTGGKFKLTVEGAFDPYEFAIVGALAAESHDPYYGPGFAGYSKRYADGFADQAIGNVMTGAVFPSLLREDPRFYQRGRGGFLRRFDYALSRMFVTRTDSGARQFNYSEFAGNAAAAGISTLYEPAADRTLSNVLSTWETQLAIDAIAYEAKEFWPDIRRKLHRL